MKNAAPRPSNDWNNDRTTWLLLGAHGHSKYSRTEIGVDRAYSSTYSTLDPEVGTQSPFEISNAESIVVQVEFPQRLVAGQARQLLLTYTIVCYCWTQFLMTIFARVIIRTIWFTLKSDIYVPPAYYKYWYIKSVGEGMVAFILQMINIVNSQNFHIYLPEASSRKKNWTVFVLILTQKREGKKVDCFFCKQRRDNKCGLFLTSMLKQL